MLKLSAKCWISGFNAQGSRGIIVAVQVGAVKIYVAAVEALRKKERQGETQETMKIDSFLGFAPHWMLMYFFARFFWISPCVWPNSGYAPCLFLTLRISLLATPTFHLFTGPPKRRLDDTLIDMVKGWKRRHRPNGG